MLRDLEFKKNFICNFAASFDNNSKSNNINLSLIAYLK